MFINKIKCICFVHLFGMISATATFPMNTDSNLQTYQNDASVGINRTNEIQTVTPNLKLRCDPVLVDQYIENPNTTIITGYIEDDTNDFSLNRSFKDALKVNIDKESVERANDL